MRRKKYFRLTILISTLTSISLLMVIGKKRIIPWNIYQTEHPINSANREKIYLGENGTEVILSRLEEKKYKAQIKKGWKDFAFNEYVSSLISLGKLWIRECSSCSDKPSVLDRSLPITSHPHCKNKYPTEANLPSTSGVVTSLCLYKHTYLIYLSSPPVIITFHNEAWSTLLRTVHSVLGRSPSHLLRWNNKVNTASGFQSDFREVILVNDGSTMEHLGESLEKYFEFWPKVKIINSVQRVGLIRLIFIIIRSGASGAAGRKMSVSDDD